MSTQYAFETTRTNADEPETASEDPAAPVDPGPEMGLIRSAIAAFIICVLGVIWLAAVVFISTDVAYAADALFAGGGSARLVLAHVLTSAAVLIGGSVTIYMLRDLARAAGTAKPARHRPMTPKG